MFKTLASPTSTSPLLLTCSTSSSTIASIPHIPTVCRLSASKPSASSIFRPSPTLTRSIAFFGNPMTSWLGKIGFGKRTTEANTDSSSSASIAQGPDEDVPAPGQQFAQFGAGCFWGVELAYQRVPGVTKTEVGYSQGLVHNPTYEDICTGTTNHSEVVRVQYDPKECSYESLLDVFWARHDPTTLNRQGNDVGTQYRSGIYYYTEEQEKAAKESRDQQQKILNRNIVTEIIPAKKFYRAEEYHQQYLAKGGRFGFKQSSQKGCNDPIRCYG